MSTIQAQNPFFEPFDTPHGTIPFDRIKVEHFAPAVQEGINRQNREIDAITRNPEAPTFRNTIVPFEKSGALLNCVSNVFGNLLSAETNDQMQEAANELMPLMSEHANSIFLNGPLFERIKAVYEHRADEQLNAEQAKLLEETYNAFVRNGANLQGSDKEKYRELSKELSLLSLKFSNNNLKETNSYRLLLTDEAQLSGLPESAIEAAAETARERGEQGWAFTLQAPSYGPFLQYADNRELRRELYMAYNTKCTHDNDCNNFDTVKRMATTTLPTTTCRSAWHKTPPTCTTCWTNCSKPTRPPPRTNMPQCRPSPGKSKATASP